MNAKEIRQWGEEAGHKYPVSVDLSPPPLGRTYQHLVDENTHNDNFGLAILQIQATLEVAAQVASLREKLNELSRGGFLDVQVTPSQS